MRGSAPSRASLSATASAADPEPPPISRTTARRVAGRTRATASAPSRLLIWYRRLSFEKVVEPEGQLRGREQDLFAGLFSAQEPGHVLDHRADDRKGRHRPGIDRAGPGLLAIRIARRKRAARAVNGRRPFPRDVQVSGRLELSEEPADRDLGARREAPLGHQRPGRDAAGKVPIEPELVAEAEHELDRESIEVLGAQDELGRKEGPDRAIRYPREERLQVLGPRRHARILVRSEPDSVRPDLLN